MACAVVQAMCLVNGMSNFRPPQLHFKSMFLKLNTKKYVWETTLHAQRKKSGRKLPFGRTFVSFMPHIGGTQNRLTLKAQQPTQHVV